MKNDDIKSLAEELKREAEWTAPAFSDRLHDRVMQQLNEARSSVDSTLERSASTSVDEWPWRIGPRRLALAAVLALVIGLWALSLRETSPPISGNPQPPAGPGIASIDALDPDRLLATARPAGQRLELRLEEARLAYLDQDARELAEFVAARMPSTWRRDP